MSGHIGPRAGGRPELALMALYKNGGRASLHGWMRAFEFTGTLYIFQRDVIGGLISQGMIREDRADYVVTAAGLNHLAIPAGACPPAPPQVAGPRVAPAKRDLAVSNMPRVVLARDGAFAYADIPSRYGDRRIAHAPTVPGSTGGR